MNYLLDEDSYYSSLHLTDRPVQEHVVFATFGEAKTALLDKLRTERDYWAEAVTVAYRLTRGDLA